MYLCLSLEMAIVINVDIMKSSTIMTNYTNLQRHRQFRFIRTYRIINRIIHTLLVKILDSKEDVVIEVIRCLTDLTISEPNTVRDIVSY